MLFHNTDIPLELINASRNGNLVIFAGAGVSRQNPLRLPDFNNLVLSIKSKVDLADRFEPFNRETMSCERYLGRLEDRYDIRSATADLLDTKGKTTELHKNIIRLFPSNENIRIVTTNFDNAFEYALDELGLSEVKSYYCPALPLGNSFSGIVYAHGSIHETGNMILTSADFGKAYVTQGWASRFLVSLFSRYTVLFIGYSCQDVLVDYLTRSISDEMEGHAYALARNGENSDDWRMRGVKVIPFDNYADLPSIFEKWSEHNKTTTFRRIKRIHEIASREQLSEEDKAFLIECLTWPDERERSIFSREFFDKSKCISHLRLLLNGKITYDGVSINADSWGSSFIQWICEAFAIEQFSKLQETLLPYRKEIPARFYEQLLWSLSSSDSNAQCVGSWLPWLETITLRTDGFCHYRLIELIRRQYSPTITESLLRIALKVDMGPGRPYSPTTPEPTLCIDGDYCRKELASLALSIPPKERRSLAHYCIRQLEIAYLIQTKYKTDCSFDSVSFGRSAIESHEQDAHNYEAIQSLIDVARDLCMELSYEEIRGLCLESSSNIAQRIGVLALKKKWVNSGSLNLAIEYKLLENLYLRHETFYFLRDAFPLASPNEQRAFIEHAKQVMQKEGNPELSDYECFNLFSWLNDGNSSLMLSIEIETILKRNPDFQKREYPDLLAYTSIACENAEKDYGIEADAFTAEAVIQRIETEKQLRPFVSEFDIVSALTNQHPSTALSILQDMTRREDLSENEVKLCRHIVKALPWKNYFGDSEEATNALLRLVRDERIAEECIRAIFFIMESTQEQSPLTMPQQERIISAIFEHWNHRFESDDEESVAHISNWLLYGMNTARGMMVALITRFIYKAQVEKYPLSLNLQKESFIEALTETISRNKQSSKTVIAVVFSRYSSWCSIDLDFCNQYLVPILEDADWGSEAAWQGLANNRYITKESWKTLSNSWDNTLDKHALSEGNHQQLLIRYFSIGVLNYEEASEKKRLFAKCCTSSEQACQHALFEIELWLSNLENTEQYQEWDKWVGDICLYVSKQKPAFAKYVGEILVKWIERCPSIRPNIALLLKRMGPDPFENGLFFQEGTLTSVASDKISNSDRSILLAFLLNNQPFFHYQEDAENALNLLNPNEMEDIERSNLMDAFSRVGMTERVAKWDILTKGQQ